MSTRLTSGLTSPHAFLYPTILSELLSHLSPDTLIAIIADLEAGCDERFPNSDATRRLLPPFRRQLVALVGEDEAAALLAANAINPNIGKEVTEA